MIKRAIRAVLRRVLALGIKSMPHGAHVTRYHMYDVLRDICADEKRGAGKRVLSISLSSRLLPVIGLEKAEIVEANYPEHNFIDLKAFKDEEFDFIISDQVLEHIEGDPQRAFDESLRVLKPGGIAVHTTCFINPIHAEPSDFWRFTPDALRLLARNFSEIIANGGWGNRGVWFVDAVGLRFTPVPHAKWHPLHMIAKANNEIWPVTTWVVARK